MITTPAMPPGDGSGSPRSGIRVMIGTPAALSAVAMRWGPSQSACFTTSAAPVVRGGVTSRTGRPLGVRRGGSA